MERGLRLWETQLLSLQGSEVVFRKGSSTIWRKWELLPFLLSFRSSLKGPCTLGFSLEDEGNRAAGVFTQWSWRWWSYQRKLVPLLSLPDGRSYPCSNANRRGLSASVSPELQSGWELLGTRPTQERWFQHTGLCHTCGRTSEWQSQILVHSVPAQIAWLTLALRVLFVSKSQVEKVF